MRASEALMIGSLHLKAVPFQVDDGNGNGCAIGMINLANGYDTFSDLCQSYPWMAKWPTDNMPCNCYSNHFANFVALMVHLFNEHVCKGIGSTRCGHAFPDADKWTLEQLADWLELIDPTPKTTTEEKHDAVEMFCENLVTQ